MSENGMLIGKIEPLTHATPEINDRWLNNVWLRMTLGKTADTSCVLAAYSELTNLRSTLTQQEQEIARLTDDAINLKGEIERLHEVRDALTEELAWEMNARMEAEKKAKFFENEFVYTNSAFQRETLRTDELIKKVSVAEELLNDALPFVLDASCTTNLAYHNRVSKVVQRIRELLSHTHLHDGTKGEGK